jgi:hypothetical protein
VLAGLLILALVVGFTVAGPRVLAHSPGLRLFRSLIPSWRFFDTIEEAPLVYLRPVSAAGEEGPWEPLIPAPRRGPLALIYNPQGNLSLALHGALDQLIDELADAGPITPEDAEHLASYELLHNLVRLLRPSCGRYQLRLVMQSFGAHGAVSEEELFVSRIFQPGAS